MAKSHIANLHPATHWPNNKEEKMKASKIDHTIDFDIVDNKIFVNCQSCNHSFELGHLEWSAIICPNCKAVIRQEDDEEEESEEEVEMFDDEGKAKIPVVVMAKKGTEQLEVLTPTDALMFLKSNECVDDDIHWVLEGEFKIGMQKLVDILICHPEFFPCLDVAIDSDPRDRKIKRMLMKAKSQPEN